MPPKVHSSANRCVPKSPKPLSNANHNLISFVRIWDENEPMGVTNKVKDRA